MLEKTDTTLKEKPVLRVGDEVIIFGWTVTTEGMYAVVYNINHKASTIDGTEVKSVYTEPTYDLDFASPKAISYPLINIPRKYLFKILERKYKLEGGREWEK